MSAPDIPQIVTPVPAASVILLRDGADDLEVLVLRKASGKHFASGAMVFPGGKVSDADAAFADINGAGDGGDPFATLKVAAVREMHEECGIVLARRPGSDALLDAADAAALAGPDGDTPLLDAVAAAGLDLATDRLVRFAHWVTPESRPKRFDTHFFIARAPAGQPEPRVDGYEIVEAGWYRPDDILDRVEAGQLKLVLPTMMNLRKLAQWPDVDAALAHARRLDVVRVMPRRVDTEDGQHLEIPAEAGYGVTVIPADMLRQS